MSMPFNWDNYKDDCFIQQGIIFKEILWEVSPERGKSVWSSEFTFEALKYKMRLSTRWSEWICLSLHMMAPCVIGLPQVVRWKIGLKRANADEPRWLQDGEETVERKLRENWRHVTDWDILRSELEKDDKVLMPSGLLTFVLQLSMGPVPPSTAQSSTQTDEGTMDTFTIVEIHDGVQMVPTNWLYKNKKKCYWPSNCVSQFKISKMITEKVTPDTEKWASYDILRTLGTAENYEKAVQKANDAMLASVINTCPSDALEPHALKRKRAIRNDLSDSEDDFIVPKQITPFYLNSSSKVIDLVEQKEDDVGNSLQLSYSHNSTSVQKETMLSTKDNNESSLNEFQVIVLQKLNEILQKMQALEDRLEIIENKSKTVKQEKQILDTYFKLFPLTTESALLELEQDLHQKGIDNLVSSLKTIGGVNEQEYIVRTLQKVLSNEIAENYSWIGSRGKKVFKELNLTKAVLSAAKSCYPGMTEKSAEIIISNWLRYAKQRRQRQEEKTKKIVNK